MPVTKKQKSKQELREVVKEETISLQEKFKLARHSLATTLVERESEIDLVLTAMIAKENPLLVGPPGVAKTRLFESLASWVQAPQFYYLMTKFTDPGEVFGPTDIVALTKERRTDRVVAGYAPTCSLICFDEIFKASSAILNCTLTLLNEHKVKFGLTEYVCPLVMVMAMSNEWPNDDNGGKELGALFDRFLFRKTVIPVSDNGMKQLLKRTVNHDQFRPSFAETITPEEIDLAHREAMVLPWHDTAKQALWEIRQQLKREGIYPCDRRMIKSIGAARANAYLQGANEVLPDHLEVLAHVLWDDPTEQPTKCEKVVARIANPLGVRVFDLQQQAQDVMDQADKQLEGLGRPGDREGVCQQVLTKLGEIKRELVILKQDARRDKVVDYVEESLKDWQYKLIGANRE